MSVSILILTLNEEANLPDCLRSVAWSDDIVVLDSFSSDRTVTIAEAMGARVVQRRFDNWSAHQNWALEHIPFQYPWVFYLDADERMTPELRDELIAIAKEADRREVAFYCGRRNMFMGRWIKHAMPPGMIMRFFRPGRVRFERLVNPVPVIEGPHGYLRGMLDHYNFSKGISEWIDKHNKYSDLEALEGMKLLRHEAGPQPTVFSADPALRRRALKNLSFRLPCRPFLKFLYMYGWKGGWLDGRAGFAYCVLQAFYEYMIVLKMREIRQQEVRTSTGRPGSSDRERPSAPAGKIIFINRYFYPDHSATSQLLSDLAFDLASRGREVHVITGGQLYTDPRAVLPSREEIRGVHVHRVPTSRFGRARLVGRLLDYLTFYLGATWTLWRLMRPGDVAVAKTDPPMLSVCAAWAVALKRGVLVNWVQDLFPEVALAMGVHGMRWAAPVLRRLRNRSLRRGQRNVVLGEIMAQRLRGEGVPADRITIIENWADGDAIQPVARADNPLLRDWRLDGRFVVGYSGNMGRAHEFKTILDAADSLRAAEEIVFLFIGDGNARGWLEAEVARRRLTNVQFRPYQDADRLRWSLSAPDVHVISLQPTLEGLIVPSKFYGVAAAGRPVIYIGDPDGEIPGILRDERCGWSFRVGDAEAVARRIRALVRNRREAEEAGSRARLAFARRYSRARALAHWRAVLDSVSGDAFQGEEAVPNRLVIVGGE
jgi:glycosyltransferase involved in cell wall biosynthesis